MTAKAFELAERFRCPVFLLTDKELAMTLSAVDVDEYPSVGAVDRVEKGSGLPYAWEPADVVQPMRRYGEGDAFRLTGSTHDEGAYITKNATKVGALNEHGCEDRGTPRRDRDGRC